MKQLKLGMFLICFALGFNSSEGKQKCCVSRAYAVCWVIRNFWENALTAKKTALYGSEAWVLENKVKNRMDVEEMSCLRSMCGVTRRD